MLCGKPLLQSFPICALNRGPGPFMSVYLTVQDLESLPNILQRKYALLRDLDKSLQEVQRQNEQRCDQEIEEMKGEIKSGNLAPDASKLRFSDEAVDEQKHAIRIADEKVALASQAYELVQAISLHLAFYVEISTLVIQMLHPHFVVVIVEIPSTKKKIVEIPLHEVPIFMDEGLAEFNVFFQYYAAMIHSLPLALAPVDSHIQQLDQYLKKYDEDLRRDRESVATTGSSVQNVDSNNKPTKGSESGRGGRKKGATISLVELSESSHFVHILPKVRCLQFSPVPSNWSLHSSIPLQSNPQVPEISENAKKLSSYDYIRLFLGRNCYNKKEHAFKDEALNAGTRLGATTAATSAAAANPTSMDLDLPVDPNEPTYCFCNQVSYGEMVACDNPDCKIEWFHYGCVGLNQQPKGKWYCSECVGMQKRSPEGVAVDVPLLEEAVPQISAQDLNDATDSVKNYMLFVGQEISRTVSQTMSQSIEPLTLAVNNLIATMTERLPIVPQQQFLPQFEVYGNSHEQTGLKDSFPPPSQESTHPTNKEQRAVLLKNPNRPEKTDKRPPHRGQGAAKDKNVSHAHSVPETRGASPGVNSQTQGAGPGGLDSGLWADPCTGNLTQRRWTESFFPRGAVWEAGTNDKLKLRLFPNSLTATAFTWYINLPPNSIQTWAQIEEMFHQQFYRVEPKIMMADLSCYRQLPQECVESYLYRFKTTHFKCKIPLPEAEYVRLALNGLDFEFKKKFHGTEFWNLFELSAKASRYEKLLKEEKDRKAASKGTYYQDPNYDVAAVETEANFDVDVAKIVNRKPDVCKAFVKTELAKQTVQEASNKPTKAYTFDITKAEAIFYQLLTDKLLKLPFGHKIPTSDELKGKEYCKYHNSWSHSTNNCYVFRNDIQDKIDRGEFKFPEKDKQAMGVDGNPFPSGLSADMVSVSTRSMPRTIPRPKVSLGAPSRAAFRPEANRYWDPYYEEDLTPEGERVPSRPVLKSIIVGRTEFKLEEIRGPKEKLVRRESVFNKIQPGVIEIEDELNNLRISAPSRGKPRIVKSPVIPPNKWQKVEHPKFLAPQPPLSRSQKRRRQRFRQVDRKAQEEVDSPGDMMDVDDPNGKRPMELVAEKLKDEPVKPRREHKPLERTYKEVVAGSSSEQFSRIEKKALLEKTLEEARIEPPPRQVTLRKKGAPEPKKHDSGGKSRLNPQAKEFRPGQASKMQCNMVVFLPSELEVKDNKLTTMEGDMVEMGQTAEILKESFNSDLNGDGPSVVILKDEDGGSTTENQAARMIFKKPTPKMTRHIKPLYISECVDGMPINRLLVDNGSAANLMPRSTMLKLGKTDQDLVSSTATLTDFTGQEMTCQGILIMNLTIGLRYAELASSASGLALLYHLSLKAWRNRRSYSFMTAASAAATTRAHYQKVLARLFTANHRGMASVISARSMSRNKASSGNPRRRFAMVRYKGVSVWRGFKMMRGVKKWKWWWGIYRGRKGGSGVCRPNGAMPGYPLEGSRVPNYSSSCFSILASSSAPNASKHWLRTADNQATHPTSVPPRRVPEYPHNGSTAPGSHWHTICIGSSPRITKLYLTMVPPVRYPMGTHTTSQWFRCSGFPLERTHYSRLLQVKSQTYEEHLEHLRRSFLRMQQFDLKVNPLKCAFGVSAGKFLGFLVHNRGIEVDKNKAKAIMEAKPPTTKNELQKLLGSLNFLRRFISNLAGKVQVFSQLLKLKDHDTFVWGVDHQKAFD
ncbi:hypothetical protein RHSIM_Rhsim02G0050900 [Rhododendron simsii]|uniref:PHD finger protein ING n=1 Tax=Rhododendron simsii TaxID=118357 RepID=A0A834HGP6_RHOSS|nr:hypothetical protein RHSIM_Rhsim02G0050900 [Rhododendron simsii]